MHLILLAFPLTEQVDNGISPFPFRSNWASPHWPAAPSRLLSPGVELTERPRET